MKTATPTNSATFTNTAIPDETLSLTNAPLNELTDAPLYELIQRVYQCQTHRIVPSLRP